MEYCIHFFGNQYGWAPYYAYPPTYIVRPNNWYGPKWNTWYQRNPHYWQNFEQKYPYWRGHHVGQRYDQNFYNTYHRGQGGGWNQGFHGVRPPGTAGPGVRGPGAPGPGVRGPGATAPASSLEPLVQAVLPLEQLLPASVLKGPLVQAVLPLKPLALPFVALVPLVQPSMPLQAQVLAVLLKPPVLAFRNLEPLVLGVVNLKKLLLLRKSVRNSSPTGANSQIAQLGRSGIILPAKSRSPWFDH